MSQELRRAGWCTNDSSGRSGLEAVHRQDEDAFDPLALTGVPETRLPLDHPDCRSAHSPMTDRLTALTTWWEVLGTAGRDQIAAVARDGGSSVPGELFEGLIDAGVLSVRAAQRRAVTAGRHTFPMPADVMADVLAQPN